MTSSEPTFTVIIPTYNRQDIVTRAIRSVLNQTFTNFELLVVDDNSPDNTRQVVESIPDSRIRYIKRKENGGPGATRNTAIRNAQGKYIALLDDDDEYLPEFLQKTYNVIKETDDKVGFTWCGLKWYREDEDGKETLLKTEIWQPEYKDREHAYRSFLRSRRIGTNCGLTFKKHIFEKVGYFDETFEGGAEDTDFMIRLVKKFDFAIVPDFLIKINLHQGPNLRSYTESKAEDYQKIFSKHEESISRDQNLWVHYQYKMGWLFYYGGNKEKGRKYITRALKKDPLHVKSWGVMLMHEIFGKKASKMHVYGSELKKSFTGSHS